ncbi:MAG: hypothetical protein KAG84_04555 [Bacteroidales bacterium]|nr:hypothetical protein [Bacteroidales bacterium]
MKRREAFKKIGLLSIISLSGFALASCSNDNDKSNKIASGEAAVVIDEKSPREKIIINRERMSFVDPENPTKAELKHTPEITFGDVDEKGNTLIKITIGQQGIVHPATESHWIDYLKVYVNTKEVVSLEFVNGGIRAFGHFYIALNKGDIIRAESGCNLHGIWENTVEL